MSWTQRELVDDWSYENILEETMFVTGVDIALQADILTAWIRFLFPDRTKPGSPFFMTQTWRSRAGSQWEAVSQRVGEDGPSRDLSPRELAEKRLTGILPDGTHVRADWASTMGFYKNMIRWTRVWAISEEGERQNVLSSFRFPRTRYELDLLVSTQSGLMAVGHCTNAADKRQRQNRVWTSPNGGKSWYVSRSATTAMRDITRGRLDSAVDPSGSVAIVGVARVEDYMPDQPSPLALPVVWHGSPRRSSTRTRVM